MGVGSSKPKSNHLNRPVASPAASSMPAPLPSPHPEVYAPGQQEEFIRLPDDMQLAFIRQIRLQGDVQAILNLLRSGGKETRELVKRQLDESRLLQTVMWGRDTSVSALLTKMQAADHLLLQELDRDRYISQLILKKGPGCETHCHRQWESVSALEFVALMGDAPMLNLLLDKIHVDDRAQALEQLRGALHDERYLRPIRNLIDKYNDPDYAAMISNQEWKAANEFWRKKIGGAQVLAPAFILRYYCGTTHFHPLPTADQSIDRGALIYYCGRPLLPISLFPISNSYLSSQCALHKSWGWGYRHWTMGAELFCLSPGVGLGLDDPVILIQECAAISRFCEVGHDNLLMHISRLEDVLEKRDGLRSGWFL